MNKARSEGHSEDARGSGGQEEADKRKRRRRDEDSTDGTSADGEEECGNSIDSEMYLKIRKMYADGFAKTVFKDYAVDGDKKVAMTEQAKAAISDLALDFSRMLVVDAIAFAHHAKRSRIAIDDVRLFCRRNPNSKKALDAAISSFTTMPTTSSAHSPNGTKRGTAGPKRASPNTSSTGKKKESKSTALSVHSPPPMKAQKTTENQKQKSIGATPLQSKQITGGGESCYFGSRSKGSSNSSNNTNNQSSNNSSYVDDDDDFLYDGIGCPELYS